jgi:uncharacterized membrane protein YhaH (DUF805 family)
MNAELLASYLFSFRGRINRKIYWLAGLVSLALIAAGGGIVFMTLSATHGEMTPLAIVGIAIGSAAILAAAWTGFALTVKRLHDRDKSAWWLIPFVIVPDILQKVGDKMAPDAAIDAGDFSTPIIAGLVLMLIGLGISLWALVEFGFLRGTAGDNRYGPDPLAPRNVA